MIKYIKVKIEQGNEVAERITRQSSIDEALADMPIYLIENKYIEEV